MCTLNGEVETIVRIKCPRQRLAKAWWFSLQQPISPCNTRLNYEPTIGSVSKLSEFNSIDGLAKVSYIYIYNCVRAAISFFPGMGHKTIIEFAPWLQSLHNRQQQTVAEA